MGTFTNPRAAHGALTWETAEYSSAQTDTVLVAAPGAGKALHLRGVKVSADTAMKVTLEAGAAVIDALYVPANGGQIFSYGDEVRLPENTALTVTTSVTGNVFVGVFYRTQDA